MKFSPCRCLFSTSFSPSTLSPLFRYNTYLAQTRPNTTVSNTNSKYNASARHSDEIRGKIAVHKIITHDLIDPVDPNKGFDIPDYMKVFYGMWYVNPKSVKLLDRELVVQLILWFQAHKLEKRVLNQVEPGMRVLQSAGCYGNLIPLMSKKVGSSGFFDVVDIIPAQILKYGTKVGHLSHVRLRVGDARYPMIDGENELYDVAYCFLLLHEVPETYKYQIVDSTLASVKKGGKVIFIDYHRPVWPISWYLWWVFRIFEPYGFQMFTTEIKDMASPGIRDQFEWTKELICGKMFQSVIATRLV